MNIRVQAMSMRPVVSSIKDGATPVPKQNTQAPHSQAKTVSFQNTPFDVQPPHKKTNSLTKMTLSDDKMQLIMNLPDEKRKQVLNILKRPIQFVKTLAVQEAQKYASSQQVDAKTTLLSQQYVFKDGQYTNMDPNQFDATINKISHFIFSKFLELTLSKAKESLKVQLSTEANLPPDSEVVSLMYTKVLPTIEKGFFFDFSSEVKSRFIQALIPKVREITILENRLYNIFGSQ